ncbi:hypothetical protein A9179_00085 [Pseudomonas alcaligenes]|uniref:Uncharacterized protein n=1 Tax=Aquipseudomonas alcaligenes TaxID=43263 RepID=A0ABR7RU88_AQUAC|nr:hypothetical protein [Pseudomonas alcaligenes]MBC9248661.1 hypothetical protein [Pseudomonas alcaligenes]
MRLASAIRTIAVALLLTALVLFGVIHTAATQEAQYSYPSPSGRFILQNVLLPPWSDLAYVRFIDTQAPDSTFRTPLYDKHYTDMRSHEDDKTVGIIWFDFDKQQQTFEIGVPEWQDSWLNLFISNTPYHIIEN